MISGWAPIVPDRPLAKKCHSECRISGFSAARSAASFSIWARIRARDQGQAATGARRRACPGDAPARPSPASGPRRLWVARVARPAP